MQSKLRLLALALLSLAAGRAPALAQDVAAGAALFKDRCQMCHTVTPGQPPGLGPNLWSVVGRKAASTPFAYSDALKGSGLVWNKATLDKFLAAPSKLAPGTRMVIAISDPKQRADLTAYLSTLKK
jgi:cytochrome c